MKLTTAELISIHQRNPQSVYRVDAQFNFDTKELLALTAEIYLGNVYFSSVEVELPNSKAEKKALGRTFFSAYKNFSHEEMPENGILTYRNYPEKKKRSVRATMFLN